MKYKPTRGAKEKLGRPLGSKKRPKHSVVPTTQPTLIDMMDPDYENPALDNVKAFCENTVEKALRTITKELKGLEHTFQRALEYESARISKLEKETKDLRRVCTSLEAKVISLEGQVKTQCDALNKQERLSRRNNFRVVGLKAEPREDTMALAHKILGEIGLTNPKLERAHRDGRTTEERDRHLLIKVSFYQDKIQVMKDAREKLKDRPYFVVDDLTLQDLKEKRKYSKVVSELYSKGTKLRFIAGRWRDRSGAPFNFTNILASNGED